MRYSRYARIAVAVGLGLAGFVLNLNAAAQMAKPTSSLVFNDQPNYQGKPLSYWINVIRDRNEEEIGTAFEAIRNFGPRAAAAVPELTQIVAAPFAPIRLGTDSDEVVADKLYDLELRSEAIDALASIGEAASPAALPVIQWALAIRVIPQSRPTREERDRFIALVTLETEYRIRVVAAVGAFGTPALPALVRLLKSGDAEKRQMAVHILGEEVLDLSADLMKSGYCDDAHLALRILDDLEPFVSKAYLSALRGMVGCDAN